MTRECSWCHGPIPKGARSDSKFCSTSHRQASHRATVRRAELERTAHPLRIAYADPPYIGMAKRYYGDQPTYDGEVDHVALLSLLETFDGWALSCSAASIPEVLFSWLQAGVAGGPPRREPRIAVWHRRRMPHPHARVLNSWEGVVYVPARSVVPGSQPILDVLLGVDARPRPTLPTSVIGMKPPAFSRWMFQLLGAMPGDDFHDLYPGSGLVTRAWEDYTRG